MNKPYHMPAHKVAVLLMTKPARTEKGRKVQAAVLFRVEVSMWIQEALSEQRPWSPEQG